jgi:hypothetical protein
MSATTIELLLTRTDRPCPTCGALLYRVLEVGEITKKKSLGIILGFTCRSCEANGMRLIKERRK